MRANLRQNVGSRFKNDEQDTYGYRQLGQFHSGGQLGASGDASHDTMAFLGNLMKSCTAQQ